MAYIPGITSGASIAIGGAGAIVLAGTKPTLNIPSDVQHARAAGQHKSLDSWPGAASVNGSLDWIISDGDQTVLEAINPTGSPAALPSNVIIVGTTKHTGCVMKSLSITATVFEPLKGSFSWEALAIDTDTNPGASTTNAFKCSKLTSTNLGTWEPIEWTINVDVPITVIHAMTSDGARLPVALAQGFQSIKMNAKLTQKETIPADMTALGLAQIASVTLAVEDTEAAPQSLTITLTNVTPAGNNEDLTPEDIIKYGVDYEAETIAFAIA